MKKYIIPALVLLVLGISLAALAQQDVRRERMQQRRQAQQQAIEKIQQLATDLKTQMEEAAQARQNQPPRENMTEEDRAKLRETFTKQREKQQSILTKLEQQITILKGSNQLRNELDTDLGELKAIRDLATEEKAEKTAASLTRLIDKKQTTFDANLKALGLDSEPRGGARRRPGNN